MIKYSEVENRNYVTGCPGYSPVPVKNNIECPKCGAEMSDTEPGQVIETMPLQVDIHCDCGFTASRVVDENLPSIVEADSSQSVTRIEVIDSTGRVYTNWNVASHEFSYQDDGKTLKIFINGTGN